MKGRLTITLTGRAPVSIDKGEWPITASAVGLTEAGYSCRLTVRAKNDRSGRALVYGVSELARAGELLGACGELFPALTRVAATLECPDLAQDCVAKLPAVEI